MGLVKNIIYKFSNVGLLKLLPEQNVFPYYHIINDAEVAHIKHLYKFKNTKQFKHDIKFLLKHYTPINPSDLLNNHLNNLNSGKHFLLTFDDGLSEVYHEIYPILKENNLSAIFFVNPHFIDNNDCLYKHKMSLIIEKVTNDATIDYNKAKSLLPTEVSDLEAFVSSIKSVPKSEGHILDEVLEALAINLSQYLEEHTPYITSDQIREMMDDGFLFGGHTMSHPRLLELSHDEQKAEIIQSIAWLKEHFDIDYSLFAFPFSDRGVSKKIMDEIFEYDPKTLIFGNSGLKQDVDERIIQRFSLENPSRKVEKQIVTENIYKYFNKLIGNYKISRK